MLKPDDNIYLHVEVDEMTLYHDAMLRLALLIDKSRSRKLLIVVHPSLIYHGRVVLFLPGMSEVRNIIYIYIKII